MFKCSSSVIWYQLLSEKVKYEGFLGIGNILDMTVSLLISDEFSFLFAKRLKPSAAGPRPESPGNTNFLFPQFDRSEKMQLWVWRG